MHTLELLDRATATGKTMTQLSRDLGLSDNALSKAKHTGKLSPAVTAALADYLGENVGAWTVAAVAENEKAGPLRGRLTRLLRGIHLRLKRLTGARRSKGGATSAGTRHSSGTRWTSGHRA